MPRSFFSGGGTFAFSVTYISHPCNAEDEMGIAVTNSGRGAISDVNLTPMIDVLLVLIVIFLIAQPRMQKAMDVQLPRDERHRSSSIVLEVAPHGAIRINSQSVPASELESRLTSLYRNRPQKIIYVKGDPNVTYQEVITAMDAARGAGVKVIAAVLPR